MHVYVHVTAILQETDQLSIQNLHKPLFLYPYVRVHYVHY